jgi:polyisoprenoid-binding protein YceI
MLTALTRRTLKPLLPLSLALPFVVACGSPAATNSTAAGTNSNTGTQVQATSAPSNSANSSTGAASPSAGTNGAAPNTTTSTSAPTAAPAGAIVFKVLEEGSDARFRVREQLAGRELPNDAVGTSPDVTGQLALHPDGRVVPEASKITVDLRDLKTDSDRRDNFIKSNTLKVDQFPTAEFVPTRIEGAPTPLPASGEHRFKMAGVMTVHGVQKEVVWDVTAQRNGSNLTGKATTAIKFGDFGMEPPKAPVVLSVVDEIRLELDLNASATA